MLRPAYKSVVELLAEERPVQPVYCVHPAIYRRRARQFVDAFPGRVLYAVKANDDPRVIAALHAGGVRHFDCASLSEIERVHSVVPEARCYFMVPTRLRGAAAAAQRNYGVRHFLIDHISGVAALAGEIDASSAVIFARMAVSHPGAKQNLSSKFGAAAAAIPELLTAIANTGAEPAIACNVGSSVTDPAAYEHAVSSLAAVLEPLQFRVRLADIGGGFPHAYPGFDVPPIDAYLETIRRSAADLPLAVDGELLVEPGRSLAAEGLSAIVEVLLRKDDRLYLNDGMYGIFWELRFGFQDRYPARCYRDGKPLHGELRSFQLYGPTCDSTDVLPGRVDLPCDIRPGDYLEFTGIGAYSLSGRTDFNGHYSEQVVTIEP